MKFLIKIFKNQTRYKIKRWQIDGAKEFKYGEFKAFLNRKSIQ